MSRKLECLSTYSNLEHKLLAVVLGLKSVENGGERLGIELDCR